MTEEQLKYLYPLASADTIARNCPQQSPYPKTLKNGVQGNVAPKKPYRVGNKQDETNVNLRLQGAKRQQKHRRALGSANAGTKKGAKRPVVRIISFRRRLLDKDNLFRGCKALLDSLRYAGLIHGDGPEEIDFYAEQIKVKYKEEEKTVIETD
jgi:hypothetical protein